MAWITISRIAVTRRSVGGGGVVATPPNIPVAPPTAAPRAAPGPPPAAAPIAAPEAAPHRPPAKPRWTGSYGFAQAERPKPNAAITQGANRVIFPRASTVDGAEPNNYNGYIAPFLSTNPALRLCEPERPATVGLRKLSGRALKWRSRRDGESPVHIRNARPAGLRMGYGRSDLPPSRVILDRGGAERWTRTPSNESSPRSSQPMWRATAV